jgi:hypothetical protein
MFNGQFHWWFGVVESRDDTKHPDGIKLGRVRVRIIGLHSPHVMPDDTVGEGIPTEELIWAYPLMPVNNAAMQGIGSSPTGIVEGTHVMGFARDGKAYQDLVIMGTVNGQHSRVYNTGTEGFCDPSGKYPLPEKLNESDVNRLARNENKDKTIVKTKNDSRTLGVPIAHGSTWDQPISPYAAVYPFNHVTESESGHIKEVDDTDGQERLHEYHKTGTFSEIDFEGNKVTKVVKDNYEIIIGNDFVNVSGNCNINITGNSTLNIEGNADIHTTGNVLQTTDGNVKHTVGGTYDVISGGNMSFTAPRIDLNS